MRDEHNRKSTDEEILSRVSVVIVSSGSIIISRGHFFIAKTKNIMAYSVNNLE
jgi:hypothetical protein